jgi:hypothetical protein
MVAMAQSMTEEERVQWLRDIENEHGAKSEQYNIVSQAVKQAMAVIQ